MSAWSEYVEWSGLDESMFHHPAGKHIPESSEVAQHRMDMEAVRLANSNRRPRSRARDTLAVIGLTVFVYVALVGLSLVVVMAEGVAP